MRYLYCKKFNEELFDLRYRPLELLKQEHDLVDLSDTEAAAALLELGYYPVGFPDVPDDGYKYLPSIPELVDGTWQVVMRRVDELATTQQLNYTAEVTKQHRNQLLAQSDWTQLADVPLSAEKRQQWETYRQALRDISSQAKFPWRIDWPVAP